MRHAPPRRTLPALAATTLLAGGLLLGQAATAPTARADGRTVVCDVPGMRQESHALRAKAARLDELGARTEANGARAEADALDRRIQSCVDAEENNARPFPR
ncbi:hypothetical protein [Streptomyces showdoensis]|uniref:Uncharacterized protein n=1 Tax=Streptomyces showdoensis TaxID=68268 RepID=A0A2P2GHK6_STREW|nr:hypothetical protein [Streptomyces showdoensis]KKZ70984.1 hypothetical protein VO63_26270 [Streptomyces showdoensis]